jgi:purine nucleosidase
MRLIIDTDTAGDDCFSILLALKNPSVKLEAITVCNGNVDFAQQVENALYTLEIAGAGGRVPVHPGCPLPMIRKPVDMASCATVLVST